MNPVTILRVSVWVLALGAVAFLCSCGDDPCEPADDSEYSRGTRRDLLNHLAESFSNKRLDWYQECLDESFIFVPTERDADTLDLPEATPWLERSEDIAAVSRIFDCECAGGVSFTFTQVSDPVDGAEEGTFVIRTVPSILMEIDCGEGDPITLVVEDSFLDFLVAEDPADEDLWIIRSMTEIDKAPGLAGSQSDVQAAFNVSMATNPSTLGYIKSIFLNSPDSRRTVDEALADYAGSIEDEDIDTYGDCLDFDHRFVFTDGVADSLDLPPEAPWWGKSKDLEAMASMFGCANIKSISFEYSVVSRDTSWAEGSMLVGARVRPDIWVLFEEAGGEPLYLVVNDEWMDFTFVGRGCCSDCWTVLSVEEVPRADLDANLCRAASEGWSWSAIKAMFH